MFCDHHWPDLHRPVVADEVISSIWTTPTPYDHYYELIEKARENCDWPAAEYWARTTITMCGHATSIPQYYVGLAAIYRGALYQAMGNPTQAAESYKTSYNALSLNGDPQWKWNAAVAYFGLGLVLFSEKSNEAIQRLCESSQALEDLRRSNAGSHQSAELVKSRMEHCIQAFHPGHTTSALNPGTPPMIGLTEAGETITPIRVSSNDILANNVWLLGKMYSIIPIDHGALQRHTTKTEQYAFRMRDACQSAQGLALGDYVLFTPQNANSATDLKVVRVDLPTGIHTTVAQVENGKGITTLRSTSSLCRRPVITIGARDPTVQILGSVMAALKAP